MTCRECRTFICASLTQMSFRLFSAERSPGKARLWERLRVVEFSAAFPTSRAGFKVAAWCGVAAGRTLDVITFRLIWQRRVIRFGTVCTVNPWGVIVCSFTFPRGRIHIHTHTATNVQFLIVPHSGSISLAKGNQKWMRTTSGTILKTSAIKRSSSFARPYRFGGNKWLTFQRLFYNWFSCLKIKQRLHGLREVGME